MTQGNRRTLVAIAATAGLFVTTALAQQQGQPHQHPQDGATAQSPAQNPPAQTAPAQPQSGTGPRIGRSEGGYGGGMMGRGMNPGMHPDMHRGMERGMGRGMGQGMGAGLSDADRTAFFEARLASIKPGLMLNDTQLRLWPAVEAAMRDMVKQRQEMAERIRKEGQPANPVDRMKRAGEMMSARGTAITRMADAMKPLHDTLTDDQKRRLRVLMRPMGRGAGERGDGSGPRRGMGPHWGPDVGQGHGMGRGNQFGDRGTGEGRRWRQDAPGGEFGAGRNWEDWRRM